MASNDCTRCRNGHFGGKGRCTYCGVAYDRPVRKKSGSKTNRPRKRGRNSGKVKTQKNK